MSKVVSLGLILAAYAGVLFLQVPGLLRAGNSRDLRIYFFFVIVSLGLMVWAVLAGESFPSPAHLINRIFYNVGKKLFSPV